MAELDARRREVKERVVKARGGWTDAWDPMLRLDPDFMEAYGDFSAVPWSTGSLEPKVKELIYIATNASTTHLHELGIRNHIIAALRSGATREEIMEAFELTSVLGIHTMVVGVPVLLQALQEVGQGADLPELSPRQEAVKAEFLANRGYWNDGWETLLKLAPGYFEAYSRFSSVPWTEGSLTPKVKELIYVAVNAATTHLFEPGIRVHVANALRHGATAQEIMEVFELVSVLGIHTSTVGGPILEEELRRAGLADD